MIQVNCCQGKNCNFQKIQSMEQIETQSSPSVFAQIVDKLRGKSEEELKLLYLKLFSSELEKEWQEITADSNFENVSDEDIVKAIQKNRYRS